MLRKDVLDWTSQEVGCWLKESGHEAFVDRFLYNDIDGKALLTLKEEDIQSDKFMPGKIGPYKRLLISVKKLQRENAGALCELGQIDLFPSSNYYTHQKHDVLMATDYSFPFLDRRFCNGFFFFIYIYIFFIASSYPAQ